MPLNQQKVKLEAHETLTMEAHAQPNRALIEWVNNTGYKNDYFSLEKANKKTGEFEQLLLVNSTSKDKEAIHYTAYDNTPDEGENTYRVKVTYQDGTINLSEIKTLTFKGLSSIYIYPNPSNDVMNIDLSNYKNQAVDVYLYNYFGQAVLVKKVDKVDNTILELNIGDQPTGNYRVRVQSKGRKDATQSVVITH
jgi:hypothetical protein